MKVKVEIECGNDAFRHPADELRRIFAELAQKMHEHGEPLDFDGVAIFDSNGNKCGKVTVKA